MCIVKPAGLRVAGSGLGPPRFPCVAHGTARAPDEGPPAVSARTFTLAFLSALQNAVTKNARRTKKGIAGGRVRPTGSFLANWKALLLLPVEASRWPPLHGR